MVTEYTKEPQKGLLAQAQHYWHVVLKWKWTAALFFFIALFAATLYSFLVPPVFTSSGSVWIEDDAKILPFEDVQSFSAGTNLQSHAQLLRSRTLAADTIDKLKLYENPDFAGKAKKGVKAIDPADPIFREQLIQSFLDSVGVTSVAGTRLVNVQFSNRNPKLATDILNALFDGYVDMIVRKRYSASEKASEFLNTQIAQLRTEIESKERELNQYGSEKDILPLTAAEAPTVSRISEVNSALTAATLDKINKLNYYNQLKAAPLGEIPDAPEGSLIQRLREQYVTLSRQYATRSATVRPEYPEMQRLKSELDSATEALQNETQNLVRNSYNDYQAAKDKELSLQKLLNDQKNAAYKANSNSVLYNSLRIELENKKTLLESLSKRQSETDVSSRLQGLEALNVWIVDKADFPLKPAFPNKRKNVLIGFLLGLAGGIGLALGLEYLNDTVKTSKDVSNSIGVPTLGSVPAFEAEARPKGPKAEFVKLISMIRGKGEKEERAQRQKRERPAGSMEARIMPVEQNNHLPQNLKIELIASREPQSIQAESYRSIRTTLLVSSPPGRIKTILFTSPLAKEGKSSTVSNMGITLAEANRRVVIVDSDLRKPKQARIFGAHSISGPGLSQYLSSHIEPADIVKPTNVPNLQLITSGPPPANPIELLTSEKMDSLIAYLKRSFDFVLFDAPPLLAVSDALAMGPMADAIILVARGGQTPIPALKQAKQKLDAHKLKCLGVILNGVDLLEQDGYYAKQYYNYSKAE
ncbi:MAG: polysaccharide biosynthesis tyrosine autokinase [Acidobacteria bacterium]|nr:polysaccharide biosynthesis tyrosine autokinase [Acidobacteriota bacterium]